DAARHGAADRGQLRRLPDDQRALAAGRPLPQGARPRRRSQGPRGPGPRRRHRGRGRARHVHARRHRLGGRGAAGAGGARRVLARRADRDGGLAALRRSGDAGDQDLRPPLRVAELDLPAAERGRPEGRAPGVRHRRAERLRPQESVMGSIDYLERIPNNVDLAGNRRLQRALEEWQPRFLEWWRDMGPEGYQARDVYLRTAISVDAQGWAQFGYLKMPDYRWGIFLAEPEPNRTIAFGDHKGEPAWQDVPGEYRGTLRRLIVTQGDTEPASVEQQRHLGRTCPSLYDLRNLFQVNVEEGRHRRERRRPHRAAHVRDHEAASARRPAPARRHRPAGDPALPELPLLHLPRPLRLGDLDQRRQLLHAGAQGALRGDEEDRRSPAQGGGLPHHHAPGRSSRRDGAAGAADAQRAAARRLRGRLQARRGPLE